MSFKNKVYTAYANPDIAAEEDRMVLVEEGFSWLAMLFTFFWLLANRLWLETLGFLLILGLLGYAEMAHGLSPAVIAVVELFLAVALGFSAFDLKRASLARRGYALQRVIVAESALNAERRYYDYAA